MIERSQDSMCTFESVNSQVTDVAAQVGQTPQGWNGGVFNMIRPFGKHVVPMRE
ncbi:MAG: hypothetical protein ACLUDL_20960 [Eubacterium callanderi]|uniref:hypothetical protein n=1 Tax=Eubacterium callanderi TaxID=53442 RepID=UPI003992AC8A